jgi:tRNA(Arg) A34 adenosine deaminase TadA
MNLPHAMEIALEEAVAAAVRGEVPVGAVITTAAGEVVCRAGNRTIEYVDPTAHAEILAIRDAAQIIGSERLADCDMYVTLEPCTMCVAAISYARIRRLYFGAGDAKMGAVEHGPRFFNQPVCLHRPEVYGGIGAARGAAMLKDFFARRR